MGRCKPGKGNEVQQAAATNRECRRAIELLLAQRTNGRGGRAGRVVTDDRVAGNGNQVHASGFERALAHGRQTAVTIRRKTPELQRARAELGQRAWTADGAEHLQVTSGGRDVDTGVLAQSYRPAPGVGSSPAVERDRVATVEEERLVIDENAALQRQLRVIVNRGCSIGCAQCRWARGNQRAAID